MLAATEALRYREPFEPGPELRRVRDVIRTIAPPLGDDRPLSVDIENLADALRQGRFDEWAIPESLPAPAPVGLTEGAVQ
jgi:histidine ammonia-lyase